MADFRVVFDPASGLVDQVHVRPPVPGCRMLWSIGATLGPAPQEESFRIDLAGSCAPPVRSSSAGGLQRRSTMAQHPRTLTPVRQEPRPDRAPHSVVIAD